MCVGSDHAERIVTMLRDPLIRLVMISDGVTEQAMIAILEQLRQSLAVRQVIGINAPSDSRFTASCANAVSGVPAAHPCHNLL